MKKILIGAVTLLALTGCASDPSYNSNYGSNNGPVANNGYRHDNNQYGSSVNERQGRVVAVRTFLAQSNDPNYGAMIAGGLIGGLLGNQVGSGSGRDLATVAGAAGGAYVGNKAANNSTEMVELTIEERNGNRYTMTQPRNNYNFYNGQRIRLVTNNNRTQVIPN